jgi:hypothetical protein
VSPYSCTVPALILDPTLAIAYVNRSFLKHDRLKDRSGGIADIRQAARLYQQQGDSKNYQQAIDYLKKWQQTIDNSGL